MTTPTIDLLAQLAPQETPGEVETIRRAHPGWAITYEPWNGATPYVARSHPQGSDIIAAASAAFLDQLLATLAPRGRTTRPPTPAGAPPIEVTWTCPVKGCRFGAVYPISHPCPL